MLQKIQFIKEERMYKTHLRNVGGSIMLRVPAELLDQIHLQADGLVSLAIRQGCLVIEPNPKAYPHYTLAELLDVGDKEEAKNKKTHVRPEEYPEGSEALL